MSHRKSVLDLLDAYTPSPEEVFAKEKMIAFIKMHENCFERSLKEGHITASAWLLRQDGKKALLMHHAKLNCWVQFGGHADGDSDVLRVAIKEAQEESGVMGIEPVSLEIFDIDIHNVGDHLHYDIRFLLQIKSDEIPQQNHESNGFLWVSKKDPLPTKQRSVVRMFEKWQASILNKER